MDAKQKTELLELLKARFEKNAHRHPGVKWEDVEARLKKSSRVLRAVDAMESSGGEPDVVLLGGKKGDLVYCDCSKQSPSGRRSICYDREARVGRKKHPPEQSALEMAKEMGIELLTEAQYRQLQEREEFDTTTSSWVVTPAEVRSLGGALFCDRRYDQVFVYHNGADSYYAARGFRGCVQL